MKSTGFLAGVIAGVEWLVMCLAAAIECVERLAICLAAITGTTEDGMGDFTIDTFWAPRCTPRVDIKLAM